MPKKLTRSSVLPKNYASVLEGLKKRIQSARLKAAVSVNRELILLYWDIGQEVVRRQTEDGWGESTVEQLASDLRKAFPDMKGFSDRNIWHMRAVYLAYTKDFEKLKQAVSDLTPPTLTQLVSEIPWGHHIVLYQKCKESRQKFWYLKKTLEYGWSRAVLTHQIDSDLYGRHRQGKRLTNFNQTLPPPQSDLAQELIKDPYHLEFLALDSPIKEKALQKNLVTRLKDFLVELGAGFAFVGNEYHFQIGGQDFYIDLLFYHLKLRCYVVIELKTTSFQPEFAGKMNFYLSAMDDLMAHPDDKPSIGIILCQDKNKMIVEYALRDSKKPIGVSSYRLTETLPKKLAGQLPTALELKNELKSK